jgi:putative membrane protein
MPKKSENFKRLIIVASIAIPLVVAVLFKVKIEGVDLSILPPVYATINGITAVLLILALIAIKKKNIQLHQKLVKTCLVLSLLFLACYVAYHITSEEVKYGDLDHDNMLSPDELLKVGSTRMLYLFLLVSHIMLSIVVIPFVLFTYLFAYEQNFEKHRKWAKIAWPIWVYVAITGVIVYKMISPFYK